MNRYYVVPTSFTSFEDVVETQLTRVAIDNSEGIVKTGIGVEETPASLAAYTPLTLSEVQDYISSNQDKYPSE